MQVLYARSAYVETLQLIPGITLTRFVFVFKEAEFPRTIISVTEEQKSFGVEPGFCDSFGSAPPKAVSLFFLPS